MLLKIYATRWPNLMQSLSGTVVSIKNKNTVTITVPYTVMHAKYKKTMKRTTQVSAHTEKEVKIGDIVTVIKCKPFSKTKHFRLA